MVQELDPGAQCSVSIYGELTGLFNKGLLKLPQDVIEIWADNGYGKMVSRRQWDDDPRSPVLTIPNKAHRARGIYYHVTFHDLQASSFLTLLPNSPHFVAEELEKVRKAKMDTLELINVGNVKPHILFIREVAVHGAETIRYIVKKRSLRTMYHITIPKLKKKLQRSTKIISRHPSSMAHTMTKKPAMSSLLI